MWTHAAELFSLIGEWENERTENEAAVLCES
jgi:hypothetical protein